MEQSRRFSARPVYRWVAVMGVLCLLLPAGLCFCNDAMALDWGQTASANGACCGTLNTAPMAPEAPERPAGLCCKAHSLSCTCGPQMDAFEKPELGSFRSVLDMGNSVVIARVAEELATTRREAGLIQSSLPHAAPPHFMVHCAYLC